MAPNLRNPRRPAWLPDDSSDPPSSAPHVAGDSHGRDTQSTLHDYNFELEDIGSSRPKHRPSIAGFLPAVDPDNVQSGQTSTKKHKSSILQSVSGSMKARKTGDNQSPGVQSRATATTTSSSRGSKGNKNQAGKNAKRKPPMDKKSGPDPPDGDGDGSSSDSKGRSTDKPLRSLREIIRRLIDDSQDEGLRHYVESGREFYIRVGTLCSGTDAPVHVMNLFSMLKNPEGKQVFTTINSFGCEIEPFKQSFLMRNSKPELLFRDAKDFALGDAQRAHLVTGAEADIPSVDLFVAGTSCVDFSTLSSTKIKEYAGLSKASKNWEALAKKHGTKLSRQHLSDDDWRAAIDEMVAKTEIKNTSTKTFAAAMNYIKARQPKVVVCENVFSAPWEKMVNSVFPLMGYAATVQGLDTKDYHMPQTRVRKYLIAFSHDAFTLEGARKLCELVGQTIVNLEHVHANSVTDFLLPPNSLELHKARNEMELASQGVRERDTDWSFSKSRHMAHRRKMQIPNLRLYTCWSESASSNSPSKMWAPWEDRQPRRVSDLLDVQFLVALFGRDVRHGEYDFRYKAQIIDCSQNVDRLTPTYVFGRTGCLTPNAIPVLTLDARPITGTESLKLQGLPVENFDMSVETQAQLQDLAGNAMTTTVVGAVILAALSAMAETAHEDGFGWLAEMFQQGDFTPTAKTGNSFHDGSANIDHALQELLHIKLYAYIVPPGGVQGILDLGERARRRCVCHHILSYSSIELHVCTVCGASFCKSCKGNPEHALTKSMESLEDLRSLPNAQAEYEFRKCFPSILWLQTETDSFLHKLDQALLKSTYTDVQRNDMAEVLTTGLCSTVYQLQFVEITDAVRLEYTADSTFILKVVIENAQIVWCLHLNEWSDTGKNLTNVLTTGQPIARAVLKPHERDQFPGPGAWEFWVPHKTHFQLKFEVQEEHGLRLTEVGDLGSLPDQLQRSISDLQGSIWTFHDECGFPENALWVHDGPEGKLFLFKDVDPIGPADKDGFIMSSTSREMGRMPFPESRSVLLRIDVEDQIHRNFKKVLACPGEFLIGTGAKLSVGGFVDGWWERLDTHDVRVEAFPNMEYDGVRTLAKGAPTSIRTPGSPSAADTYNSCDKYQDLITTSLPMLGKQEEDRRILETIKTLDLTQQLDLAEFVRLVGPSYSAVEMGLLGTGRKVTVIQEDVVISSDCICAPKIPEVFYVKAETGRGAGSRASGSLMARHRETDQQNYEQHLQSKPPLFRIDHNVTSAFNDWRMKKDGFDYVDLRILAHGHALLHQARAYLSQHPAHYHDTNETRGTFAMEIGVIEDPRIFLRPINILAPEPVALEDARHPSGFQSGLSLFKEQMDSLQWMLQREEIRQKSTFVEKEVAEVYLEKLRLRIVADAKRTVVRRGRVVADNVGFGKTAVSLGLIDVQHKTDRRDFLKMRQDDQELDGLVHLHATLIIVPNQLTRQWADEAKRFLNPKQYNIVMIETYSTLQKLGIAGMKKADIIICSNKVFQENAYHSELSRYCRTNGLDKIRTVQKVYRAWYKQFQSTFSELRRDVVQILDEKNSDAGRQQRKSLRSKLDRMRREHQDLDGAEELCFAPSVPQAKKANGKVAAKAPQGADSDWNPLLIFELFSFSRIIWDEFPYENIPVTEFVANCATTAKWMLSGTPPMENLGDVCRVAYLFNVHLARPLRLIKGRQPPVCEHEPLSPHSDLESTNLFQSRHSPKVLAERHERSLAFVRTFMRKNGRKTDVSKTETPLVLTMSKISFLSYAELQLELRSRQYNANSVGSDPRRRLMNRVGWKGKENGRDRSVEALMIRASAHSEDVLRQSCLSDCSDLEAAKALLDITEEEIRGTEDRGRELLAKSIFLAYRLAIITISNTTNEKDGQEERQLNYYQNLVEILEAILQVDMDVFQSWDAFQSAMRMLIWDDSIRNPLTDARNGPQNDFRELLRATFEQMRLCDPPVQEPKCPAKGIPSAGELKQNYESKKEFLEKFRNWFTKTPLHSRRWFLLDQVNDLVPAEEELLKLEWLQKVPWEENYDASPEGGLHVVVPISRLCDPSKTHQPHQPVDFDINHLQTLDSSRRTKVADSRSVSSEEIAAITARLQGYKDTKVFWEEECNRRGLVVKATDKKDTLIARVAADQAKIATDEDYVSPESCGLGLDDFPREGKTKIRGGHMEVIFNLLMQAVDSLTSCLERNVVAHAKRNLQGVIAGILDGTWVCKCGKTYHTHYVSLLCGHVFCDPPDVGQPCGVSQCRRLVKNVCIPLSKITQAERVITASSLGGAINRDPEPYLDSAPGYQGSTNGPKVRAVINLISRIERRQQVVVFVQNAAIESDIYSELAAAGVTHVTAPMLANNEADNLERFKKGDFKVLVQIINSEQSAGSNLHNANHIIFVSPLVSRKQSEWDDHMKQALGRCVRFRQSKMVYVYHMLMDETIEVDTLEWRMKQEVITTEGQAAARFNECSPTDFLARNEGLEAAPEIHLEPNQSRAVSILPRDDIQSLMGDDYLSLASIKALRTIDEAVADKDGQEDEALTTTDVGYLLGPEVEYQGGAE
ncbi:hypothetical protein Daus18300_003277 [Diaporthe australafricana]|uniref:Helicase ATP-binding domain-containing protein n=1 Tax=Diaporthe australafricana TaxID=127596 RepID=A0ABR3XGW8_9PEZI